MISIESAVVIVVYLLVAALVFGLLYWLITYVGSQFAGAELFVRVARVILVILAVLVLIGILLSFSGHPIFVGRGP